MCRFAVDALINAWRIIGSDLHFSNSLKVAEWEFEVLNLLFLVVIFLPGDSGFWLL